MNGGETSTWEIAVGEINLGKLVREKLRKWEINKINLSRARRARQSEYLFRFKPFVMTLVNLT